MGITDYFYFQLFSFTIIIYSMSYEVTATRRRPQQFDDLVGQEFVAETLKNSIKSGKFTDVPEVSDSFFRGWYYLKESGFFQK